MLLKQKLGFYKREFELIGDRLRVKYIVSGGETKEWFVKLEDIGDERYYKSRSRAGIYFVAGFFFSLALLMTFVYFTERDSEDTIWTLLGLWLLLGGLGLMLLLMVPKREEIFLIGGNVQISFFQTRPSKEVVNNFIEELILQCRENLLSKYGKVDPDLPEDVQISKLKWLKDKNVISEEMYEQLKMEYRAKRLMR